MKKFFSVSVVLFLLAGIVFAGGGSDESDDYKLVLRMSHVFAPNEQLTKSLQIVCDNIFERTNGAIEIQHYPNGQLATYKDGVEQVALGANFISVEDPSYLGDYVPDFNALVGPMLYSSFDEYLGVIETDLVQDMIQELEEVHRIKPLALDYIFGFRNMKTNKVIVTPDDLKGMKIRVPGSQLFIDTLNAMGANAVALPFGETISAVQQGVVDGLEGVVDGYDADGSAEVAKNMAFTKHFLGTCGAYINVDLFESIPEEYQVIIQEEFTKGAMHMIGEVEGNYDSTIEMLKRDYDIQFNDVDFEAFSKLVAPVYENMKGTTPGILDDLKNEISNL